MKQFNGQWRQFLLLFLATKALVADDDTSVQFYSSKQYAQELFTGWHLLQQNLLLDIFKI